MVRRAFCTLGALTGTEVGTTVGIETGAVRAGGMDDFEGVFCMTGGVV